MRVTSIVFQAFVAASFVTSSIAVADDNNRQQRRLRGAVASDRKLGKSSSDDTVDPFKHVNDGPSILDSSSSSGDDRRRKLGDSKSSKEKSTSSESAEDPFDQILEDVGGEEGVFADSTTSGSGSKSRRTRKLSHKSSDESTEDPFDQVLEDVGGEEGVFADSTTSGSKSSKSRK